MVANIFGKIYGIVGKLEAQNTLSRITRQIARLTKEIGRAEKQHNAAKITAINNAKSKNYQSYGLANASIFLQNRNDFGQLFKNGQLDFDACSKNKEMYSAYQQAMQQYQQFGQSSLEQELAMIEDEFDARYEIEIQSLKDQQVDLEAEKVTAQNQLQVFEGMEKQEGEFAKKNIQNMFEA